MGALILQTVLGVLGGIVSAVVGWLLQRQLRAVLDASGAAESKASDAQTAAAGASRATAGTQAELAKTQELLRAALGQIDRMAARHDDLWAQLLRKESYGLRLRAIEEYLAQHEAERLTVGLEPFRAPLPADAFTTGTLSNRSTAA